MKGENKIDRGHEVTQSPSASTVTHFAGVQCKSNLGLDFPSGHHGSVYFKPKKKAKQEINSIQSRCQEISRSKRGVEQSVKDNSEHGEKEERSSLHSAASHVVLWHITHCPSIQ
jgi:hypothetical protein